MSLIYILCSIICAYLMTLANNQLPRILRLRLYYIKLGDSRDVSIVLHHHAWWRHQMEPFSALLATCAGNSPIPGEFPSQGPVTQSFDVFFDLRLNERWSNQWWGWWFWTPFPPLWCHCNGRLQISWCHQEPLYWLQNDRRISPWHTDHITHQRHRNNLRERWGSAIC